MEQPAGLVYRPDLVSFEEELELLPHLEALEFEEVRMRGQVARRTVRHFGLGYEYEARQLTEAEPIPDWLRPLRDRAAELAAVAPDELAETLVTRYPPGAGIGWHRDAPMFGLVVGVSLGSPCRMRFRRGDDLYELELAPRSAYVLKGSVRWAWQHSIPETKALRYSVTFRTLR